MLELMLEICYYACITIANDGGRHIVESLAKAHGDGNSDAITREQ
jgi:hypothetical protein